MVFKDILVPVDFTVNTGIALKKAIELLDVNDAVINLLHVVNPPGKWRAFLSMFDRTIVRSEIERLTSGQEKLERLRNTILTAAPGKVQVECSVMSGAVEDCIIKKAKLIKPGLVVVGKNHDERVFPVFNLVSPNRIAQLSNSPVLVAKSGSLGQKIRTIVVPVSAPVSQKKIEILVALLNKFHAKVHLVTLKGSGRKATRESNQTLLNTYRALKNMKSIISLEHKVVEGRNLPNASLKYAQFILADMMLVCAETETKVSVFTRQHITDLLITNSRLQVLEVES